MGWVGDLRFFAKCTTKQRLTHFPWSGQGQSSLRGDPAAVNSVAILENRPATSCDFFFFLEGHDEDLSWIWFSRGRLRSHWQYLVRVVFQRRFMNSFLLGKVQKYIQVSKYISHNKPAWHKLSVLFFCLIRTCRILWIVLCKVLQPVR